MVPGLGSPPPPPSLALAPPLPPPTNTHHTCSIHTLLSSAPARRRLRERRVPLRLLRDHAVAPRNPRTQPAPTPQVPRPPPSSFLSRPPPRSLAPSSLAYPSCALSAYPSPHRHRCRRPRSHRPHCHRPRCRHPSCHRPRCRPTPPPPPVCAGDVWEHPSRGARGELRDVTAPRATHAGTLPSYHP